MKFAGKWPGKFSGKFSGRASGGRTGALPYVTTSSDYDGTNDYATSGTDLTGSADGKQGTISAWVRLDGGDGAQQMVICGNVATTSQGIHMFRSTGNTFAVRGRNAAGTQILNMVSTSTHTAGATWVHVLASWSLGAGAGHLYVGDVDRKAGGATLTDDSIDYTTGAFAVGGETDGGAKLNACLSELFFHTGYLDISVESNRRRFINAHGKPVGLGHNGSRPLGVQPLLYAPSGDPSANLGSGGNLTITGALSAGSTSPTD